MADKTADAPKTDEVKEAAKDVQSAPQKFRVAHAAVSGVAPGKDGKTKDHDFYTGDVVNEHQLDGNAAQYVAAGAIVPI